MKLEDAIKTNKFPSQKQKATLNLLYTSWWLKTIINKELKAFCLTEEQYNVLRILKGSHPEKMCVKEIGSRMIERSSNVPRIMDRLVAKQMVLRSASEIDKRETVSTLTPAGISVLEDATKKLTALFETAIVLNEQDALQMNNILEKLREKE